jgi:hypothetical protein
MHITLRTPSLNSIPVQQKHLHTFNPPLRPPEEQRVLRLLSARNPTPSIALLPLSRHLNRRWAMRQLAETRT